MIRVCLALVSMTFIRPMSVRKPRPWLRASDTTTTSLSCPWKLSIVFTSTRDSLLYKPKSIFLANDTEHKNGKLLSMLSKALILVCLHIGTHRHTHTHTHIYMLRCVNKPSNVYQTLSLNMVSCFNCCIFCICIKFD